MTKKQKILYNYLLHYLAKGEKVVGWNIVPSNNRGKGRTAWCVRFRVKTEGGVESTTLIPYRLKHIPAETMGDWKYDNAK